MGVPQIPRFSIYAQGGDKIGDLGYFMRCAYWYWYQKGFWGVAISAIIDFLNTLAVFILAFIFTMRFHWESALNCTENECTEALLFSNLSRPYIIKRNFVGYTFGFVFLTSSLVATLYEGCLMLLAIRIHREVDEVSRLAGVDTGFLTPIHRWAYQRRRGVGGLEGHEAVDMKGDRDFVLTTMPWDVYLHKICTYINKTNKLKFYHEPLDALRAVQALLQRENFLVAIHDSGMLDHGTLSFLGPDALSFVVSTLFDPFNTVYMRYESIWTVRAHILAYIILHLCLFLFITTYITVKVLVKNAGQFKSNYREFSQNEWNHWAFWRFRLFNEVDHLHQCRLVNAREIAVRMVSRLSVSDSMNRLMRRLSSTFIFIFITLSFLNSSLLISGHFASLSFVWWLTISLLVYTSFSEVDPREREYVYTEDLKELVGVTHFSAPEWYVSGDSFYYHLSKHFFKSLLHIILHDLFCDTMQPFLLLWALRDGSVDNLLEFMRRSSVFVEGVGSVVLGSAFESMGSPLTPLDDASDSDDPSSLSPFHSNSKFMPKFSMSKRSVSSRSIKLYQSVASFAAVYPQWMVQHVDDVASAPDPLHAFLGELRGSVEKHFNDSSQSRNSDRLRKSWNPYFSVQSCHEHNFWEGGKADMTPGWCVAMTSHERERLFVSQLGFGKTAIDTPVCETYRAHKHVLYDKR
ncbi:unnamed protein product [Phytomonas sp. EM1]|nr:unnamed protein product [Phytomonas sp. EM1]|eukprot:CCW61018.1 unnamed protein product [Phytomonas sp. isolate EM1]